MSHRKNNIIAYDLKNIILHIKQYETMNRKVTDRTTNLYFQNKRRDLPENISQTAPNINMNISAFTYHWFAYTSVDPHGHVNPQNLKWYKRF